MSYVHEAILNLGEALGYSNMRSTGGVCTGISWLWLASYFIQDEEKFNLRLKRIKDESQAVIINEISKVKEKVKKHEHLSDNDIELLEIYAFYDHLVLYHLPVQHQSVFETPYPFDKTSLVTQRFSSNKIEALGGLDSIYSDSDLYCSREKLFTYLNNVTELIKSISFKPYTPIGLVLTNYDNNKSHTLSLAYDINQNMWHLMDIDRWPSKILKVSEITSEIIEAFGFSLPLVLSYEIVSTLHSSKSQNHKFDRLVDGMQLLNKSYRNFSKSLQHYFNTLLFAAAHTGNINLVKILLSYPIDINAHRLNGATAVFMASQKGYAHIVRELRLHGADLNIPHVSGATATFIAAQNGHLDVIRELGIHGADLNKCLKFGTTPVWIATNLGHFEIIKELGKYPIDLYQPSEGDVSPLELARKKGYKEIEKYLLKLISDRRLSYGISDALSRNGIFKTFLQSSDEYIHAQFTQADLR